MYFIGVADGGSGEAVSVSVLFRYRAPDLRKHFNILSLKRFSPDADAGDMVEYIESLYHNSEYHVKKPLFNQNGRPTKRVTAKPEIYLYFADQDALAPLFREKGIRVNTIAESDHGSWDKIPVGQGLGMDYEAVFKDFDSTMRRVQSYDGIHASEGAVGVCLFDQQAAPPCSDYYAVALPVWFGLNLRHQKTTVSRRR